MVFLLSGRTIRHKIPPLVTLVSLLYTVIYGQTDECDDDRVSNITAIVEQVGRLFTINIVLARGRKRETCYAKTDRILVEWMSSLYRRKVPPSRFFSVLSSSSLLLCLPLFSQRYTYACTLHSQYRANCGKERKRQSGGIPFEIQSSHLNEGDKKEEREGERGEELQQRELRYRVT